MFGDDPDPTVAIVRVGFGDVSDTGEGSMHYAKRVRRTRSSVWFD